MMIEILINYIECDTFHKFLEDEIKKTLYQKSLYQNNKDSITLHTIDMSNINTICFLKLGNFPTFGKFLNDKNNMYINIISSYFDYKIKNLVLSASYPIDNNIDNFIKTLSIDREYLYVFNELDYCYFLYNYIIQRGRYRCHLLKFLKKINYVVFFCELFENDDLKTIGSNKSSIEFAKLFFVNAKKIITCNTKNILYLKKHGINNVCYFPPYGYSLINNISPINGNLIKNIDYIFMGSVNHPYRKKLIDTLHKFSKEQHHVFHCYNNNLFDEQKDEVLKNTKIVIHIPSHENLHTFPWAKTVELMAKKVFFIIENNEEMYIKNLDNIVVFYTDFNDLCRKIEYYLENENERINHVEKCYDHIVKNYDMDKFLCELFKKSNQVMP